MSARTTVDKVKEIIITGLSETEISAHITAANVIVTANLVDEEYTTSLLAEIERWLAAHFVAVADPRVKSETIGAASASYHGSSGFGLDHTPYGQQVKLLDSHGVLAAITEGKGSADLKAMP